MCDLILSLLLNIDSATALNDTDKKTSAYRSKRLVHMATFEIYFLTILIVNVG